ncbi:MAG: SMC-Scp complex subunit ScpB [Candidatus Hodarchaeota archaeon]
MAESAREKMVAETLEFDIKDAKNDDQLLLQLVEACLYMKGKIITEGEITNKLNLPAVLVRKALEQLSENYKNYNLAIQVRNVCDDQWIMDIKDLVSEHVESFYIEKKPYTRSEVMTLSFVAYTQPIPKKVLSFYRGSGAVQHVKKWMESGFMKAKVLLRDSHELKFIISDYERDLTETLIEADEEIPEKAKLFKKKELECFVTTPKFTGYFNLPEDIEEMKDALEEMKDIYDILG